ncbi:Smr/MutS family protein [Thiomicrospira microaerophila]|uniref:Smr/MutS family protein n=1 Tax=Thiomicrospira microaerophila TaxID=406020 RepID=UPI00200F2521|nr:Smr/MutS family protein [Thiomicrospira microaerophila]UQB41311.1 Smr/MutS family protein [Thiomicrospira microaerophila]
MSKVTEEDKLLFKEALVGVSPLIKQKKVEIVATKPKAPTKRAIENKYQIPPQKAKIEYTDSVNAHENLLNYRKGLRIQDLKRLRKGEFTIQGRLDLHGYTEEGAELRLSQFIHQSYLKKYRYLLVVHGKGYNSDTSFPVLKNLVNRMLRSLPEVIAFCSATQKDGGVGAVYVLIKAQ